MIRLHILAGAAALLAGLSLPALAQNQEVPVDDEAPIEVEAQESIEWRQEEQVIIARGDATVVQGDVSVRADQISAFYRTVEGDQNEVERIEAVGNVIARSADSTVYGDHGVYDLNEDMVRVTGDDLRLESAEQRVTAEDSLEYWNTRRVAIARGNAIAEQGEQRVRADTLTAHLRPQEEMTDDRSAVQRIEAEGNVLLSMGEDVARGERGDYNVDTGQATLTGNVRITRGQNQLNGEVAEVNMNTGVSRLRSGGGGRVRGLFTPQSTNQ